MLHTTLTSFVARLAAVLCCLALCFPTAAQPCGTTCVTTVPGPNANGTWTAAGSPYCVTGNLTIGDLTIQPGVCVLVDGPYSMEVAVRLRVLGTEAAPVTITARNSAMPWRGISFNDTGPGSEFNWCTLSHSDNSAVRIGGASSAAPIFRHCTIANNTAPGAGGGIIASVGQGDMVLDSCRFENNQSRTHGGALRVSMSSGRLHMTGCAVSRNTANPSNFGGNYFGGGIYLTGAAFVEGSIFDGNECYGSCGTFSHCESLGSSILCDGAGAVDVQGCSFTSGRCHTTYNGTFGSGVSRGAIYHNGTGTLSLVNCIFGCNTSTGTNPQVPGLWVASGTATVTNCTFARNSHEAIGRGGGTVTVRNSIVFFNNLTSAGPPPVYGPQFSGTVSFECSDVQGGVQPGTCSNISANPGFRGTGCDPCSLWVFPFSPCVDAGDPLIEDASRPPGHGSERSDMGAHGGAGNTFWRPTCLCDWNGDCTLNSQDFFDFLSDLFAGAADFNNDGVTNSQDLFDFLNCFFQGCD